MSARKSRTIGGRFVSNAELRDAAQRAVAQGRVTWNDLACSLGGTEDGTRVRRMLGVTPQADGTKQATIRDESAAHLCAGLGVYPRDLGL